MPREARETAVRKTEEKIERVIARYRMFPPGCAVVAGFSGGADSTALTHFLYTHRARYGIVLIAAHINHGLRGEEADADEAAARRFCAELGIPFRSLRADVAALAREQGLCLEDCGRRVRYAFFRSVLQEQGCALGRIATAHTASDNAETMLMNLARGAGTHGLRGILPVRGQVVRPLLALTRAEVEAYCASYGLSFVQDASNDSEAYARNRVRHGAVPVLRTLNPALEDSMLRAARLLSEDDALLTEQAQAALDAARHGGGWDLRALRKLPSPLLSRALMAAARSAGASRLTLEQVDAMARAVHEGGGVCVAGGIQILARGNTLFAQSPPAEEETGWCVPLRKGEALLPDGRCLRLRPANRAEAENPQKFYNFLFHNPADYDTIQNDLFVRTRRPGDRFRLPGRSFTRPLRRLLAEAGVPPAERDSCLLLGQKGREELLWAEQLGPGGEWAGEGALWRVEIIEKRK